MFDIVIVLYQMTYSESSTITSLNKLLAFEAFPEINQILIFDNSEKTTQPQELNERFEYFHSKTNVGLAKAYNQAIQQSKPEVNWLVTLDQDTLLTSEYLHELLKTSQASPESVVAIAPVIQDQDQQISPVRSDILRPLHNALPLGGQTYSNDVMVINSGTAIRMDFLQAIGGYNLAFPLDYLDHWLSWRIFTERKQLAILKTSLQHELSVLNYAASMNLARYKAILSAEKCYYSFYQTKLFSKYRRQLFLRGCKQLVTGKFSYGKFTLKYYFSGGNDGIKSTNAK